MANIEFPIADLHEWLILDEATGFLFWKKSEDGRCRVGGRADKPKSDGYLQVWLYGKHVLAHRVIFAMVHGRWPKKDIDHINVERTDNRPSNLREADCYQNQANTRLRRGSKTGYKGVSIRTSDGKFYAYIRVHGKRKNLGAFAKAEEAHEFYSLCAEMVHGEYARAA